MCSCFTALLACFIQSHPHRFHWFMFQFDTQQTERGRAAVCVCSSLMNLTCSTETVDFTTAVSGLYRLTGDALHSELLLLPSLFSLGLQVREAKQHARKWLWQHIQWLWDGWLRFVPESEAQEQRLAGRGQLHPWAGWPGDGVRPHASQHRGRHPQNRADHQEYPGAAASCSGEQTWQLHTLLRKNTCGCDRNGCPLPEEASLRDCERLSALVDLQCVPASERVQEGGAFRGLPGTGHAAGHPAGHPMCLWHCQGSQAACHHHHKGEYQLTALTGLQSRQHLSFVLIYIFNDFVVFSYLWYMHALFFFNLWINLDNI